MAIEPELSRRRFVVRDTLDLPTGTVQITDRDFLLPVSELFTPEDALWIDMCLTPRPEGLAVRYADRWPAYRFEHLGQVCAMPAGETLQFQGAAGRQISITCQLRLKQLDYLAELQFEWTDKRLESCLDIPNPRLSTMLRYLAEEVRRPDLAREAMAELMLGQIAIELARHLRNIEDPVTIGGLAGWRMNLIDERLTCDGPPPSLAELAELCALSVRQLTRAFRASRGCSVNDHVNELRMERAKRLLAGPDSVKTIAFTLGFRSASIFARAFHQHAGMTPRQFRSQALAGIPAT